MKVFDKIRDLFTEEVEVEGVEEPVKKEVIQVEIPAPEAPKEEVEEVESVEEVNQPAVKPQEEKYSYPVFFDEKDFDDIEKHEKVEVEEPKKEVYKDNYKELYTYKKEVKEDKKKFAPSPVISPVYGVLDKNYKKDDIVDKARKAPHKDNSITIDDVRNKAYGTLEDELESTLFGKTSILFANKDEKNNYSDIEEELKDTAASLDLLMEDPNPVIGKRVTKEVTEEYLYKDEKNEDNTNVDDDKAMEDLLDTQLEEDLLDNMAEDKIEKDFESNDKLSESDLFNLIDDMYEKGDN